MAKVRTRKFGIINVVKTEVAGDKRFRVTLSRKTIRDGSNRYAVIIRDRQIKRNVNLHSYETISEAYTQYKAALAILAN